MDAGKKLAAAVTTAIVFASGASSSFGQPNCPTPALTKTEAVLKAFEALKSQGIGLVSYENLYIRVEREGCAYRVVVRDDPPKPSGVISVELSPTGSVIRANLD